MCYDANKFLVWRLALNWKKIDYQYQAVNLLAAEQSSEEYSALNPARVVPTLAIDGIYINDSVAILEYLEVHSCLIQTPCSLR